MKKRYNQNAVQLKTLRISPKGLLFLMKRLSEAEFDGDVCIVHIGNFKFVTEFLAIIKREIHKRIVAERVAFLPHHTRAVTGVKSRVFQSVFAAYFKCMNEAITRIGAARLGVRISNIDI